jgi:hypothetical protein
MFPIYFVPPGMALAGPIFVNFVKPNPSFVHPGPSWSYIILILSPQVHAGHNLVDLVQHDSNFVIPGPIWSHFG